MTETSPTLADLMDERLAMLWYQVDRVGDCELRERSRRLPTGSCSPATQPSTTGT